MKNKKYIQEIYLEIIKNTSLTSIFYFETNSINDTIFIDNANKQKYNMTMNEKRIKR